MNERVAKNKTSVIPSQAIQSSSLLLHQRPLTDELSESVGSNSNISKELGAIQPKTIRRSLNWQNITVEAPSRSNGRSLAGSIQRQPTKRGAEAMETGTPPPEPSYKRPQREAAVKANKLLEQQRQQEEADRNADQPTQENEKEEDKVLNSHRATLGVPKFDESGKKTVGGVIGIAKTDIPGLKDRWLIGASPEVRNQSSSQARQNAGLADLPPEGDIKSPGKISSAQNHAEQDLANQIVKGIKSLMDSKELTNEDLKGKKVSMHIDQAVCSTCKQGLTNPNVQAGVLKQLSDMYPDLKIVVTAQRTTEKLIIEKGIGTRTGVDKKEE